jgi:CHAT domain-containing protein
MRPYRTLLPLLAACALTNVDGAASAAPAGFVIGRTPTGAVCMAKPTGTTKHHWRIQCDGDRQGFGALTDDTLTDDADAETQAQIKTVDGLTPCRAPEKLVLQGLEGVRRTVCPARRDGRDWILFEAQAPGAPGRRLSLELPAELADLAGPALRAPLQSPPDTATEASVAARWTDAYRTSQAGDFSAAEKRFSEITLTTSGADGQRAEAYLNWARESSNLGRPMAAAEHFRQADALIEVIKDPDLQALSALYKAIAARNESRFEDAVRWAHQSIEVGGVKSSEAAPARAEAGEIRIDGQTAERLNAESPGSEVSCGANAIGACAQHWRGVRDAYAAYLAGTSLEALGDYVAAARALDDAADRISSTLAAGRVTDDNVSWFAADIQAERARLALDRGDTATALTLAQAAREVVRGTALLAGGERDVATRLLLARVEAAHNDTEASRGEYDLAFETLRTGPGGLIANPEDAEAYFEGLLRDIGTTASENSAVIDRLLIAMQSLQFDETGGGLLRLRRRLEQGEGPDAALAKDAAAARQALAIARLKVDGSHDDDAASRALRAARDVLRVKDAALFARHPELVRTGSRTVTAEDLRRALAKDELYVKIVLFANQGYGVAVDTGGVRAYRIPIGRKDAATRIDALRRPFDDPIRLTRFDVEASYQLYSALFGPVADAATHAARVIYDVDGSLLSLPPALLVTDAESVRRYQANLQTSRETRQYGADLYAGVHWLGRLTDVTSSLSPQSFLELRRRPPSAARRTYVGYGPERPENPEDPNLFVAIARVDPYAQDCADTRRSTAELAAQAPPKPASTTALRNIAYGVSAEPDRPEAPLSDFRVLLIGARGLTPSVNGCLGAPALATSLGEVHPDGLLTADRIARLKLDAELVVLTGWNTGVTPDAADGEDMSGPALVGLADAFAAAGARNLLFSHWEAPTRATVQLITQTLSAGGAESTALRQAQIRLMDAPSTSHPYYWAGFSLAGDGARTLAPPPF